MITTARKTEYTLETSGYILTVELHGGKCSFSKRDTPILTSFEHLLKE